ncbi:MAG: DNA/RNA nuclease SfsA [Gammaproteobacteria bacterium]|nr:MAG: DNA/RNA nuclease SfsA [Gammaproteobacteria bacterium]
MKFSPPLLKGKLLKRYKRFLADVELPSGEQITIHCPNTGSMKNCNEPGASVWFSDSQNPKRKYQYTWEIVTVADGAAKAGINTGRANKLVKEAIEQRVIQELQGYDSIRTEVKYGQENSRIDLLLEKSDEQCFVEIKNATLGEGDICYFPDAVTERGRKHLRELAAMVEQGHRGVLLFCVQHTGVNQVRPADHIDPAYGETLRQVVHAGVEVLAYQAVINEKEIFLRQPLPVVL